MIDVSDPEDPSTRHFYSQKEFTDIGMSKDMLKAMPFLKLRRPSKIQAIAYKPVFDGDHCIVADQTGSGKTLAYLLPLTQRITQQIKEGVLASAKPGQPYVLILAPTSELAIQTARVARSVAQTVTFRSSCITGSGLSPIAFHDETDRLKRGVEMLVATPGKLIQLLESKQVDLSKIQTVVLDETDVLFMDDSFRLQPIGAKTPLNTQYVFVTATLPKVVVEQITQEFPDVKKVTGPGLHRVSPTIDETLIDCSGPPNELKNKDTGFERKKDALVKLVTSKTVPRTLVFCNTIQACRKVENALNRADKRGSRFRVLAYHAAVDNKMRDKNLADFTRPLSQQALILVCTDRASRGADFDRTPIDHVVLFDFPREPSEYVRRVGRTGRAGRRGMATILAQGRQMPIARQVMQASRNGAEIEPIPEMNRFDDDEI